MRRLGESVRDDRGAVIVLVAILLAGGVLSGLLAIVADLGRVYAERRVVQNGADAAVLALAQHCAQEDADCRDTPAARATAEILADANAPDLQTAISDVCGSDPLAQCLTQSTRWNDCQPVDAATMHYARVRTQTESAGGELFFAPIFAGLLEGGDGAQLSAAACAQAAWGPAASVITSFPILLPICPGEPGGPPVVISRFDSSSSEREWTDCVVDGVAFDNVTAGFSWTRYADQADLCLTPVTVRIGDVLENYTSDPSACGPGNRTDATLRALVDSGAASAVPVVGGHAARGGLGEYDFTVISFKSMTLLGYKVQGTGAYGAIPPGGWNSAEYDCAGGNKSCLYATFSDDVVPGEVGGDPDLGVRAVQLIP